MELDPPAIEIVPENDPWNVLEIDLGIDLGIVLGIDLGIVLGNVLQNASMRSRNRTSIP